MYTTSECITPIPWRIPVISIVLYRKMQSFGATLTVGPHFFCLMGQTILVAFSLKTSRARTDMLSYQNDARSNSQKLRKPQTARASRVS